MVLALFPCPCSVTFLVYPPGSLLVFFWAGHAEPLLKARVRNRHPSWYCCLMNLPSFLPSVQMQPSIFFTCDLFFLFFRLSFIFFECWHFFSFWFLSVISFSVACSAFLRYFWLLIFLLGFIWHTRCFDECPSVFLTPFSFAFRFGASVALRCFFVTLRFFTPAPQRLFSRNFRLDSSLSSRTGFPAPFHDFSPNHL